MNIIKAFFYKNDCALCVWARYCVFFALGVQLHKHWPTWPTTAAFALACGLCIFFTVLSIIPENGEVKHIIESNSNEDS